MAYIKEWALAGLIAAVPTLALGVQDPPPRGEGTERERATAGQDRPLGQDATRRAQDPTARGQAAATRGQEIPGRASMQFTDQLFIAAATEGGTAELMMSQLAARKATSEEVKKFAQQMIEDHTRCNQELMQLASTLPPGAAGVADPTSRSAARPQFEGEAPAAGEPPAATRPGQDPPPAREAPGRETPGQQPPPRREGVGVSAGAGGVGVSAGVGRGGARVGANVGQTEVGVGAGIGRTDEPAGAQMRGGNWGSRLSAGHQAAYAILASKSGEEFDRCYMQGQVAAHKCAVSLFKAESEMGQSEGLKQFATETLPKLEEHLQMAQQLAGPEEIHGAAAHEGRAIPDREQPTTRPSPETRGEDGTERAR